VKTLGVVPARMGSKGIPGKNKRLFHGKPLFVWAVEVGRATCDRVVVSSDDPEILSIAEQYGVEALERPAELATDETPMVDVLKHVLACQTKSVDAVVLLQPTQPLREAKHVKQALWALTLRKGIDSVASIVEIPPHMSPDYACKIEADLLSLFLSKKATRRQECRAAYYRDGTVYVIRPHLIRQGQMYGRCAPLLIPLAESCTIDTEADWVRAEGMAAHA